MISNFKNGKGYEYVEADKCQKTTDKTLLIKRTLLRRLGNYAYHTFGIEDLNPQGQAFSKTPPKNLIVERTLKDEEGNAYLADCLAVNVGTVSVFFLELVNNTEKVIMAAMRDLVESGIDNFMPALVAEHNRQSENAVNAKPKTGKTVIAQNSKVSARAAEASREAKQALAIR
jgi:hypothetical protein|tara:strand:+ start:93 stop:611 length:519 start_codon:yes stop_codon:yes gene_type:complete